MLEGPMRRDAAKIRDIPRITGMSWFESVVWHWDAETHVETTDPID